MALNKTMATTAKNSLVQRGETFSSYLAQETVKAKIKSTLGEKDGQRFIASILSAVSVNPGLAECEKGSIVSAALLGESLKLSPSPQLGYYYMVPFNDKNRSCKVATFQIGYKGYLQLAMRSGFYKKINVIAIKEGELKGFDILNEEIAVEIIEDDEEREKLPTIGYYAMFEYHNGFRKAMYWSRKKMLLHADKYSQAFSAAAYKKLLAGEINEKDMWKYSSFWYKDFDGMAYKTMLRQLIGKWGILSVELQKAIEADATEEITPNNFDGSEVVINMNKTAPETAPETAEQSKPAEETAKVPEQAEEVKKTAQQGIEDEFFSGTEQ